MIAGPRFLSHGQMRKSWCCCSFCKAHVWYRSRFGFPVRILNNLSNLDEKYSSRLSKTTGGFVQCGGVQLDRTYIFGSYDSSEVFVLPAKWKRRWIARWKLGIVVFSSFFHMFVRCGVGINLSPRPRSERRLFGGCFCCVKSWKAKWDGREK